MTFKKIILRFIFFSKSKEFILEEKNIKDFFMISILGGIILNFLNSSLVIIGIFNLLYFKNTLLEFKKNYQINFFNIYVSGVLVTVICIEFVVLYYFIFICEDFFLTYYFIYYQFNWLILFNISMAITFLYKILFRK